MNWKLFRNLDLLCVISLGPGSGWLDRGHPWMMVGREKKKVLKCFWNFTGTEKLCQMKSFIFLISSFSVRQMKAGWSLSFVYDSYLWVCNHHCGFPRGDFKVSSFFSGWELILEHLLFRKPGILFCGLFPGFPHSHLSGLSLRFKPHSLERPSCLFSDRPSSHWGPYGLHHRSIRERVPSSPNCSCCIHRHQSWVAECRSHHRKDLWDLFLSGENLRDSSSFCFREQNS